MARVRPAIFALLASVPLATAVLGLGGCTEREDDTDIADAGDAADAPDPIELTITPTSADLGSVMIGGATGPEWFTVEHVEGPTSAPLTVEIITGDALDFRIATDNCTGKPLSLADTCTVAIELAPVCIGPLTTILRVWNRSGSPEVRAHLEGEGLPLGSSGP